MKYCLLAAFILSTFLVIEAIGHLPEEVRTDSEHEAVYRFPRGVRDKKKGKNLGECRYKKGPWDDCDAATNTEKRTLLLKRGDSTCEQTKVFTRKCKKACKYEKGEWSDCDSTTNVRTRTDSLKPKSDSSCQSTRTISKKCKKVCRYSKQATWTECDAGTGKKTKVLVLTSGDPQTCEPNKKITKNCRGGRKGVNKGRQADDDDDYDDEEK